MLGDLAEVAEVVAAVHLAEADLLLGFLEEAGHQAVAKRRMYTMNQRIIMLTQERKDQLDLQIRIVGIMQIKIVSFSMKRCAKLRHNTQ